MKNSDQRTPRCDIALLVDAETGVQRASGEFVPDRNTVEAYVLTVLREQHENVVVVPFDPAIRPTRERLRELSPRVVFNLTEWIDGDRSRDVEIVSLLERLGLAYTGSAAAGMRLSRDKARAKAIVARLGGEVARGFVVPARGAIRNPGVPYPLVVKPQFGDGSDEVRDNSLVKNDAQFVRRARLLRERVRGPLLCEEYVPGRDLYVALLGNQPEVMPPVRLVIGRRGAGAPSMATYRLKGDGAYRTRWRVRWQVFRARRDTVNKINKLSATIFRGLKLRDYARIDYRLTDDGRLVFLEANANPDLHPHAMGINLCFAGVRHADAIRCIVRAALARRRR